MAALLKAYAVLDAALLMPHNRREGLGKHWVDAVTDAGGPRGHLGKTPRCYAGDFCDNFGGGDMIVYWCKTTVWHRLEI